MYTWFRTAQAPGWVWTPWTKRFAHGGWVYLSWRHPWRSLRWWWNWRDGVFSAKEDR